MTPDLQARIIQWAADCSKNAIAKLQDDAGANLSFEASDCETLQIIVAGYMSTLAEQIIAEKDADAAGMRAAIQQTHGHIYLDDDVLNRFPCHSVSREYLKRLFASVDSTAGRDTLAELISLRDRVKELEGRIERYENSGRV